MTFETEEIKEMINDFRDLHGSGMYAEVFKGQLNSEDIVVKVYKQENKHLTKVLIVFFM